MAGFIKLNRNLKMNKLWLSEPFTRGQAWVDLLMLANYKDGLIFIRGNQVTVLRGQCGWSEVALGERWSWSRGKVRRYLKMLKTEQQIVQQKTSVTSLITLLNYELYQGDGTADDTTGGTADGHQTDIRRYPKKEVKKDKKVKNTNFKPPSIEEVSDYCKERGNNINPKQFINHYTTNGWMRGKTKIKDWKACVRTWENNQTGNSNEKGSGSSTGKSEFDKDYSVGANTELPEGWN